MNVFQSQRKFISYLLAFFSCLFCSCLLASSKVYSDWYQHSSTVFGTSLSIELWLEDADLAQKIIQQTESEMWRIHHLLSPYEEESELSQVNLYAHEKPKKISQELVDLLAASLFFSRLSEGAFDISFSSVGSLYNYREGQKPSQEQIDGLKASINYRLINLDRVNRTVQLNHPSMKIDLGGIAKGYAMDKAVELLVDFGVKHATVSAGGDMRVLGDKRGRPWLIGIKNPRQEATAVRLPLESVAVSTSGDYERFFIEDATGERVHHILDPATGRSAAALSSATVIGERGFDTDPLSTTVFVLGIEKGLELINSIPEFDAVLIDTTGRVHYSQGLIAPD